MAETHAGITVSLVLPYNAVYKGNLLFDENTKIKTPGFPLPAYYNHDSRTRIGDVLALFKGKDGLYAVFAFYKDFVDILRCREACTNHIGFSIGGNYNIETNELTIEEISLTETPYFSDTFKNATLVFASKRLYLYSGMTQEELLALIEEIKTQQAALAQTVAELSDRVAALEQQVAAVRNLADQIPGEVAAAKAEWGEVVASLQSRLGQYLDILNQVVEETTKTLKTVNRR